MKRAIEETARRRKYQEKFNKARGITPTPLVKTARKPLFAGLKKTARETLIKKLDGEKRSASELKREIEAEMLEEAAELNFERAAELRDLLKTL